MDCLILLLISVLNRASMLKLTFVGGLLPPCSPGTVHSQGQLPEASSLYPLFLLFVSWPLYIRISDLNHHAYSTVLQDTVSTCVPGEWPMAERHLGAWWDQLEVSESLRWATPV